GIKLEKKRQMIKMNKQKSKNQVKQTIGKKDKIKMLKNEKERLNIKQSKETKIKTQNEGKTRKTKDIIKSLNITKTLNEQN
ncbi:MAG: hypothetical protein HFJ20_00005, partial [Clostridia bacterium]|nr:hypothetical protein [Clostridia bacterium]